MKLTEKTIDMLMGYAEDIGISLLVLVCGLILTKILLKIARTALDKSSLDESVYEFLLKTIK